MKVLHIITRMNTGGPAVFLDHLTTAMGELGVNSTIAYGFCEANETDYTENNIMRAELIKIKALHRTLNPIDDIRAFIQIRGIIKAVKPDIINTHTSKAGVLGRVAAKTIIPRPKVVHTFLGHLIYGYFSRSKIWIFISIEKIMTRFTSAAIAVTAETKQSLISKGVGRKLNWEIIRIGIPVTKPDKNDLSPSSKLKILWVGRFTDIKDPGFAVETMRELSQRIPNDFELIMVGGGELFEEIVKLAANLPIRFVGVLKEPFKMIQNFDLLMMTSKNEGLPLVILEAANCLRATVSTNVGGISEFIENDSNGYLVPRNTKLMAEKIIFLASDKERLRNSGINARHLLEKSFSDKQMARLHFNLYSSLVVRI
jgi:glycosyltransferase involved in cell wall biosynthesis